MRFTWNVMCLFRCSLLEGPKKDNEISVQA